MPNTMTSKFFEYSKILENLGLIYHKYDTYLDRARIFYNFCSSRNYSALEDKNVAKFRGEISGACLKTNDEIITSSFKPELLVPSNSRMKRSKEVSWYSLILIGFHWFIDLSGKYFGKYFDLKKIFQKIKCYEVLGSSLLPSSLPSTSYRGYEVVDPEVDYQVVRGLGWE